jgi:hypothetical protein
MHNKCHLTHSSLSGIEFIDEEIALTTKIKANEVKSRR